MIIWDFQNVRTPTELEPVDVIRFLYDTFVKHPGPRRCAGAFCTFTDNTKRAVGEKRFNQFCSNGVLNFMMINSPGGPRKADDSDHPLKEMMMNFTVDCVRGQKDGVLLLITADADFVRPAIWCKQQGCVSLELLYYGPIASKEIRQLEANWKMEWRDFLDCMKGMRCAWTFPYPQDVAAGLVPPGSSSSSSNANTNGGSSSYFGSGGGGGGGGGGGSGGTSSSSYHQDHQRHFQHHAQQLHLPAPPARLTLPAPPAANSSKGATGSAAVAPPAGAVTVSNTHVHQAAQQLLHNPAALQQVVQQYKQSMQTTAVLQQVLQGVAHAATAAPPAAAAAAAAATAAFGGPASATGVRQSSVKQQQTQQSWGSGSSSSGAPGPFAPQAGKPVVLLQRATPGSSSSSSMPIPVKDSAGHQLYTWQQREQNGSSAASGLRPGSNSGGSSSRSPPPPEWFEADAAATAGAGRPLKAGSLGACSSSNGLWSTPPGAGRPFEQQRVQEGDDAIDDDDGFWDSVGRSSSRQQQQQQGSSGGSTTNTPQRVSSGSIGSSVTMAAARPAADSGAATTAAAGPGLPPPVPSMGLMRRAAGAAGGSAAALGSKGGSGGNLAALLAAATAAAAPAAAAAAYAGSGASSPAPTQPLSAGQSPLRPRHHHHHHHHHHQRSAGAGAAVGPDAGSDQQQQQEVMSLSFEGMRTPSPGLASSRSDHSQQSSYDRHMHHHEQQLMLAKQQHSKQLPFQLCSPDADAAADKELSHAQGADTLAGVANGSSSLSEPHTGLWARPRGAVAGPGMAAAARILSKATAEAAADTWGAAELAGSSSRRSSSAGGAVEVVHAPPAPSWLLPQQVEEELCYMETPHEQQQQQEQPVAAESQLSVEEEYIEDEETGEIILVSKQKQQPLLQQQQVNKEGNAGLTATAVGSCSPQTSSVTAAANSEVAGQQQEQEQQEGSEWVAGDHAFAGQHAHSADRSHSEQQQESGADLPPLTATSLSCSCSCSCSSSCCSLSHCSSTCSQHAGNSSPVKNLEAALVDSSTGGAAAAAADDVLQPQGSREVEGPYACVSGSRSDSQEGSRAGSGAAGASAAQVEVGDQCPAVGTGVAPVAASVGVVGDDAGGVDGNAAAVSVAAALAAAALAANPQDLLQDAEHGARDTEPPCCIVEDNSDDATAAVVGGEEDEEGLTAGVLDNRAAAAAGSSCKPAGQVLEGSSSDLEVLMEQICRGFSISSSSCIMAVDDATLAAADTLSLPVELTAGDGSGCRGRGTQSIGLSLLGPTLLEPDATAAAGPPASKGVGCSSPAAAAAAGVHLGRDFHRHSSSRDLAEQLQELQQILTADTGAGTAAAATATGVPVAGPMAAEEHRASSDGTEVSSSEDGFGMETVGLDGLPVHSSCLPQQQQGHSSDDFEEQYVLLGPGTEMPTGPTSLAAAAAAAVPGYLNIGSTPIVVSAPPLPLPLRPLSSSPVTAITEVTSLSPHSTRSDDSSNAG